jgi:DME family drug/metabolite transporter
MMAGQHPAAINADRLGFMMIILAGICFGSSGIMAKTAMEHGMSPLSAASYRFTIASLVLIPAILFIGPRHFLVKPVDMILLGAYGTIGVSTGILLYFLTIRSISASLAVLLLYLHPVFTLVAAKPILHERITPLKALAAAIVLAGCILALRGLKVETTGLSAISLATGAGAGLAYSFYTVFGKLLIEKRGIGSQSLTVYSIIFSALALSAIQGLSEGFPPIAGDLAWLALLGLALIPTLLAFALYTSGLRHIDAGKAGIIGTVETASTLVLAFLLLGERLDMVQWIGALMVLCGISIVQKQ